MKRSSGFTLVELIVVVAVISILVLIAIYPYYIYTQRGHKAKAIADARQCVTSAAAALAEDPNTSIGSIDVPANCTLSSLQSCTCTSGNYTAQCNLDGSNHIVCQIVQ